jgi:predicted chitinase
MTRASALQQADAKRIAPPAAHQAGKMVADTEALVEEINEIQSNLKTCLDQRPHDKAEILRLVENFKKRAMSIHGKAVTACQTIRSGR